LAISIRFSDISPVDFAKNTLQGQVWSPCTVSRPWRKRGGWPLLSAQQTSMKTEAKVRFPPFYPVTMWSAKGATVFKVYSYLGEVAHIAAK